MLSRNILVYMFQILLFEKAIDDIFGGALQKFHQTDYSITLERYNIIFINKSYFGNIEVSKRFVTRYEKRYNLTVCLLENLDAHKIDLHIEGRKFQSNEYRLFPFNYTENTCLAITFPQFGNYLEKFNCNRKTTCNIARDTYNCPDIHAIDSEFPPFAPRGKFKLTMRLFYQQKILLGVVEYFIEIKPSNPLERTIGV